MISNPPLQNIPIRTEIGKQLRDALAVPKHLIMHMDYAQVEMRIAARYGNPGAPPSEDPFSKEDLFRLLYSPSRRVGLRR